MFGVLRRREKPPPSDVAGQAELVEPLGLITGHARPQQIPFPRDGRCIRPLEHGNHVEQPIDARFPRFRHESLVPRKKTPKRPHVHGLDLFAKAVNSEPMDARSNRR